MQTHYNTHTSIQYSQGDCGPNQKEATQLIGTSLIPWRMENEKRAAQEGFELRTFPSQGRCSTNQDTEAAQLAGPNQDNQYKARSTY